MDLIDKPKVVVISLMFNKRYFSGAGSVTGDVSLWTIEIELTFSTFANNSKQCGAVNMLEGHQITLIVSKYSHLSKNTLSAKHVMLFHFLNFSLSTQV